jgi:hypothetical protein
MTCEHVREELGAYAMGLSEPRDRARVEQHLAGCERCRWELDGLQGVVAALGGVPASDLDPEGTPSPRPDPLLERLARERTRERRRTRLAQGLGGAGTIGALALAVVAWNLGSRPVDPLPAAGPPAVLREAPGAEAQGTVRLTRRPWGTQVDFETSQLPPLGPGEYYKLWLIEPDGTRNAVGTFAGLEEDGETTIRLTSAERVTGRITFGVTRGEEQLLLSGPAAAS